MAVLPQRTLDSTRQEHLNDHNALAPLIDVDEEILTSGNYQYTIRQASLGGAVAARPTVANVPNGGVTWMLFNEPNTAGGPTDVESLDLVINISGTAW